MLNPFPIQWLALFAYFFLRLCVGIILLHLGYKHWRHQEELRHVFKLSWWPFGTFSVGIFIATEVVLSIMFILGFYTQIAALVTMLMCIKLLIFRGVFDHHSIPRRRFYALLFGVALSLFITGAGVLAFDLPI